MQVDDARCAADYIKLSAPCMATSLSDKPGPGLAHSAPANAISTNSERYTFEDSV
jgi:hypothetical protein